MGGLQQLAFGHHISQDGAFSIRHEVAFWSQRERDLEQDLRPRSSTGIQFHLL
jgi:hypothetical protein